MEEASFTKRYPNIAFWIDGQGWIELGYDVNTDTCARALDEGGMVWSGASTRQTADEWMEALEAGVRHWLAEQGLR